MWVYAKISWRFAGDVSGLDVCQVETKTRV